MSSISTGSRALDSILGSMSPGRNGGESGDWQFVYFGGLWGASIWEDAVVSYNVCDCSIIRDRGDAEEKLRPKKTRGVDGGLLMSIPRVSGVWVDVGTFFALNGLRVLRHGMVSMENESPKISWARNPCTVSPLPFHNPLCIATLHLIYGRHQQTHIDNLDRTLAEERRVYRALSPLPYEKVH